MDMHVQHIPNKVKNTVEIVVYIKKDLAQDQQQQVSSILEQMEGISRVEFCPLRNHLVLTKYNRDIFSSQDVLKGFNSLDLEAKLIGPI